jgi:hypothetical protein
MLSWESENKRNFAHVLPERTLQMTGFSVRLETLTAVLMESLVFSHITPCNPLKVNRRLGGTCCLHLQGGRISQARNWNEASSRCYSSTLKLEAICSSETPVDIQRTTLHYIPEDINLHNPCWGNPKSYNVLTALHCSVISWLVQCNGNKHFSVVESSDYIDGRSVVKYVTSFV